MRDGQCTSADATDQKEEADAVSKCIGDSGRWQIQMIILLSLFNIPCTWHIYSMAFQGSQPDFWCAPPLHLEGLPSDLWRNKTHTRSLAHNAKDNPCFIWDVNYENMTVEDLVTSNFHNISDLKVPEVHEMEIPRIRTGGDCCQSVELGVR
ncbi:UNVERIFIED_CONTAM: hypothetical protein PYX00_003793 [Menopon gallinae]|uniref:Uncharacterized protein n=1 Tax=Menopon gallinae TaxID=328185 RepID=A0AAW2I1E4_9NEOP